MASLPARPAPRWPIRRPARAALLAVSVFGACLLLLGVTPPARAEISLLFHADLAGQFAAPRCGQPGDEPPDYAAMVATLRAHRQADTATFALLGGNAVAPDLFTRSQFETQPQQAARFAAAALALGEYDAFTIGRHDLSLGIAELDAYVDAMASRGLPLVLSNVRCPAEGANAGTRRLCGQARPSLVLERAGQRIAVLATLSPRLLSGVPPLKRVGLEVVDPVAAVKDEIRRLAGAGAGGTGSADEASGAGIAAFVLIVQVPSGRAGLDEIRELQESFRGVRSRDGGAGEPAGSRNPDVILAGGLFDSQGSEPIRLLRGDRSPPVVGSTMGTTTVAEVVMEPWPSRSVDVRVWPSGPDGREEAASGLLADKVASYCETFGKPIGPQTRRSLGRDEFIDYVLGIMRKEVGAEIALVNNRAIRDRPFPIFGPITRAELYQAMPYRATLVRTSIPGARLAPLLGPTLANPKASNLGFQMPGGGAPTVNGRPVDTAREYRIVTVDFVAAGGDAILPVDAAKWEPMRDVPDLRDLVEEFIRSRAGDEDGDPTVDPSTDLGPPPGERALWVSLHDIGVDLTSVSIRNHERYGDPQLARAEQRAVRAELTSTGQLRSPRHEGDGRFIARYGRARTQPAGLPAVSAETADLLTASATYNYRGLRADAGPTAPIYLPDPFARVMFESEFTRPPVTATQTRDYRHAELTVSAGPLFPVDPKLRLRVGPGLRAELVAPGRAGRLRPLMEAGVLLLPVALATFGPAPIRIEGTIDYLIIEPRSSREQQVRASARLSVPIAPLLFLTAGLDYFAVERQPLGWAGALDATVGLRVHLDVAHQSL